MYGSFLNRGIIVCGVTVTLCIMMAAFSVSVRFVVQALEVFNGLSAGCHQFSSLV